MSARKAGRPPGLLVAALVLLAAACSRSKQAAGGPQQTPAPLAKGDGPGPAVGGTLPALEVRDQTGKVWTLESLRGPKGLLLNINRSVVW